MHLSSCQGYFVSLSNGLTWPNLHRTTIGDLEVVPWNLLTTHQLEGEKPVEKRKL
jgi:hypothetical protein